jgi:hypothetical protein
MCDVGGSGGMQQSPLAFHGNTNSVQQIDGIRFNNLEGAGQYSGMYWNDGMIQEISTRQRRLPRRRAAASAST